MEPWVIVLIIFIVVIVASLVYKNRERVLALLSNKRKNKQFGLQSQQASEEQSFTAPHQPSETSGASYNNIYDDITNMGAVGANFL